MAPDEVRSSRKAAKDARDEAFSAMIRAHETMGVEVPAELADPLKFTLSENVREQLHHNDEQRETPQVAMKRAVKQIAYEEDKRHADILGITVDELRTRIAKVNRMIGGVEELRSVINNPGSHPEYHREQLSRLQREWPTLWNAIQGLINDNQ